MAQPNRFSRELQVALTKRDPSEAGSWLATLVHLTGVERCYAVKRLHPHVAGRPQ
ncbi:hypothetical protein [Haliangium sp.]|uniref:hypothetical protein n=1 Tax=Haliangium sp. TaxID=2663208 RepID=UPI003D0E4A85